MNLKNVTKLGALSLINFANKHADRAAHHALPAIAAREPVVKAATQTLQDAYSARRPLAALRAAAVAKKDSADDSLDQVIRSISYDLLAPAVCNKDRSHVQYRVLFPKGNLDFVEDPERSELAQVAGMVTYLKANPDHPMAARASILAAKAAELDAALAPVANAEAALANAQAVERAAREALQRALKKSLVVLRDQLDGNEEEVDKLFPTFEEARVPEPSEDPQH